MELGSDPESRKLLDYLDSYVKDDGKIVSFKWFSREHSISSSHAKKIMSEYALQNKQSVKCIWSVSGLTQGKDAHSTHLLIRLMNDKQLENEKVNLIQKGKLVHEIYSVQLNYPCDFSSLCDEQLFQMQSILLSQDLKKQEFLHENRSIKCSEVQYYDLHSSSSTAGAGAGAGAVEAAKTRVQNGKKIQTPRNSAAETKKAAAAEATAAATTTETETKTKATITPTATKTVIEAAKERASTSEKMNLEDEISQESAKFFSSKGNTKQQQQQLSVKSEITAQKAKAEPANKNVRKKEEESRGGIAHLWQKIKKGKKGNLQTENASRVEKSTVDGSLQPKVDASRMEICENEEKRKEQEGKDITSSLELYENKGNSDVILVSDGEEEEEKEVKFSVSRSKNKSSLHKRKKISDDEEEESEDEHVGKKKSRDEEERIEEDEILCSQPQLVKKKKEIQNDPSKVTSQMHALEKNESKNSLEGKEEIDLKKKERDHISENSKRKKDSIPGEHEDLSKGKPKINDDDDDDNGEDDGVAAAGVDVDMNDKSKNEKELFQDELNVMSARTKSKSNSNPQILSPKRMKNKKRQIRTVMDEKGRETFEVVWVEENGENEKSDASLELKSTSLHPSNKNATVSKPSHNSEVGKVKIKSEKGKVQDNKGKMSQGSLLSFFGKK